MGDLNAKVGTCSCTGYEKFMGQGRQEDENVKIFADFRISNSLDIGGNIYHYKRIHKVTWISPDYASENQIYHLCIAKKRRFLRNVRVKRCADVD
jgi:hypothetical protein